jgi:mxaK protein
MAMTRRRLSHLLLALLALSAALAAAQAWRLQGDRALNRDIAAGGARGDEPSAAPELRFARAYSQSQAAQAAPVASGAADAALNRYAALYDTSALGRAARYNSANLLIRQAVALRAGDQAGQALALIELAKENYREVLRQEPNDWDARYNLERAQRLLPDPDGDEEAPAALRRDAERAATTMRGHSPGLP